MEDLLRSSWQQASSHLNSCDSSIQMILGTLFYKDGPLQADSHLILHAVCLKSSLWPALSGWWFEPERILCCCSASRHQSSFWLPGRNGNPVDIRKHFYCCGKKNIKLNTNHCWTRCTDSDVVPHTARNFCILAGTHTCWLITFSMTCSPHNRLWNVFIGQYSVCYSRTPSTETQLYTTCSKKTKESIKTSYELLEWETFSKLESKAVSLCVFVP